MTAHDRRAMPNAGCRPDSSLRTGLLWLAALFMYLQVVMSLLNFPAAGVTSPAGQLAITLYILTQGVNKKL